MNKAWDEDGTDGFQLGSTLTSIIYRKVLHQAGHGGLRRKRLNEDQRIDSDKSIVMRTYWKALVRTFPWETCQLPIPAAPPLPIFLNVQVPVEAPDPKATTIGSTAYTGSRRTRRV